MVIGFKAISLRNIKNKFPMLNYTALYVYQREELLKLEVFNTMYLFLIGKIS